MTETLRIPVLFPMIVGASAVIGSILIHAVAVSATVRFVNYERKVGRAGASFRIDLSIVSLAMLVVLIAHLIEIGLWALLFVACGEFRHLGTAYYHSAVNYTTLGYGDLVMSPAWRLLGPLEAANGELMFGVSTGMVFALIQLLIVARFERNHPAINIPTGTKV